MLCHLVLILQLKVKPALCGRLLVAIYTTYRAGLFIGKHFLKCSGRSWTHLKCSGRSWTHLKCSGRSWTLLKCSGRYWTLLKCSGRSWTLFKPILNTFEVFRLILNIFEVFRPILNTFEVFRPILNTFEVFRPILNTFEVFRPILNTFEVFRLILNTFTHQHYCAQVELLVKLRDEDVRVCQLFLVFLLHLAHDFRHPLKLLLRTCYPQEVNLFGKKEEGNLKSSKQKINKKFVLGIPVLKLCWFSYVPVLAAGISVWIRV